MITSAVTVQISGHKCTWSVCFTGDNIYANTIHTECLVKYINPYLIVISNVFYFSQTVSILNIKSIE